MTAQNLATRVAVATGLPVAVVERVLDRYGFTPQLSSALPRPMRVLRLRITGVRSVDPLGEFDSRIEFGSGLTVLAADNLRGKTSVLELLTWCLRGSPRSGLQGVVRSWLNRLDCDAVVAGRCLGFRLTLNGGDLVSARVLSASDCDSLVDVDAAQPDRGVVEILYATDEATFATMVESLMMELLNLERLESTSSRSESGRAVYGWPAYYGALYLPPGGEPALLGDAVMGGLPGRLLQVFLDLPSAALLTRMKAVRDQLVETERAVEADAAKLRLLLDEQRRNAQSELEAVRGEFANSDSPTSTADLVKTVSERTASAVLAEASVGQARETFEILRWQRRRDEKRLNDVREHQAARLLFHALDPQVCPRCESPISPQRRDAERVHAICAVCTEPAVNGAVDSQQQAAVQQEAEWRLRASRNAEQAGKTRYDEAAEYAKEQRRALADAERALAEARNASSREPRRALIDRITRLEGAVAALESVRTPAAPDGNDDVHTVLDAAVAILTDEQAATSDDLFGELNANIADLARSFGFRNLDRVAADRAGRLQVYKTGGPREWFRTQSPGERLRLRIAVIVALLRIGHRHGIATHPGLLMIDSPRSEEVQDDDAVALLTALEQLCVDMPGLQILVTTADETLVRETLTRSTIIAPAGPGQPLW